MYKSDCFKYYRCLKQQRWPMHAGEKSPTFLVKKKNFFFHLSCPKSIKGTSGNGSKYHIVYFSQLIYKFLRFNFLLSDMKSSLVLLLLSCFLSNLLAINDQDFNELVPQIRVSWLNIIIATVRAIVKLLFVLIGLVLLPILKIINVKTAPAIIF